MQELSCSRQELSGNTHYAVVQPEKVVRAPAGLRLVPMRQIDGRRFPEQADIILGVLRGCMALKALLCSGNDASS